MSRRTITVLALLAVPGLAMAQAPSTPPKPAPPGSSPEAAAAPAAPELPKPAPELQKVAFLSGDWIHDETYQASPMGAAGKGAGRSRNQWILGDHHLYMVYAANTPIGKVEGRGLLYWDRDRRAFGLDWYDNLGVASHFTGDFAADGALVLAAEYVHEGQKVKEQVSFRKQDDGNVSFRNLMAFGDAGEMKPVIDGILSPKK